MHIFHVLWRNNIVEMLYCQLPSVNIGHVCSALTECELVLISLKGNWSFDIGAQALCGAATGYPQTMKKKT